jgi:ribonuclease T2
VAKPPKAARNADPKRRPGAPSSDAIAQIESDGRMSRMTVSRLIAGVALLLALFSTSPAARAQQPGEPGVFDYYLLNLSWEPEFCHSRRNANSEECQTGGRGFIVHGLWPQFTRGYPERCSDVEGLADPSSMLDLMPDRRLVRHEWTTHGTCSGLSAADYFAKLRQAYSSIRIPEQLKQPGRGFSITPDDLKQAFVAVNPGLRGEDIGVSCGHNYLTAIEICLDKTSLRPASCGTIRDCHANIIRVTPVE